MSKTTITNDEGHDVRQALDLLPRISASPDFELRVYQKVAARQAGPLGWLDKLDNLFAVPAVKLLGSAAGGLLTGLVVLLTVGRGPALSVGGGSAAARPAPSSLAAGGPPTMAEAFGRGDDYATIFDLERRLRAGAEPNAARVRDAVPATPRRGAAKEGSWILGASPAPATASASSSGSLC